MKGVLSLFGANEGLAGVLFTDDVVQRQFLPNQPQKLPKLGPCCGRSTGSFCRWTPQYRVVAQPSGNQTFGGLFKQPPGMQHSPDVETLSLKMFVC